MHTGAGVVTVMCVQGFPATFGAHAFVPRPRRGVGGWMMGRSDPAARPSTPCSAAHARGQDKGIGNYSPDSFILPAVPEVSVSPGCIPRGLGGSSTPYSKRPPRGQCPLLTCHTRAGGLSEDRGVSPAPLKVLNVHPCAPCSFRESENHPGCPPSSFQGGNVSGEADEEPSQALDEYS